MEVVIKKNRQQASVLGAKIFSRQIEKKPDSVLGLATGSTPLELYDQLAKMYQEGSLSFSKVTTFNLDEYVGLNPDHPSSYHSEMHKNLFSKIDINLKATHLPDGCAKDIPLACQQYEEKIASCGGIDIQLLGIGTDGHLAFNEPGSSLSSRTRIKTLSQQTLKDNSPYFSDLESMPRHVVTMGLGNIMEARSAILLAFGKNKAKAVKSMIEGPVSTFCPASILQFHPKAIIILDEEAAGLLERKQYYLDVYEGKPDWQRWE